MTEIKMSLSNNWKRRILGWSRDLILILGMWSIWLVRDYIPDVNINIKNILTAFLVSMIGLTVLIREYVDYTLFTLEAQLEILKAK